MPFDKDILKVFLRCFFSAYYQLLMLDNYLPRQTNAICKILHDNLQSMFLSDLAGFRQNERDKKNLVISKN